MADGTHTNVAVITPTYNRWPYVCEAIESVCGRRI